MRLLGAGRIKCAERNIIRARLTRLLAINLGSVGLAALGLAMLVAGLML